jgi:23S rRNA (uracil1939-C5)-methyltransferase
MEPNRTYTRTARGGGRAVAAAPVEVVIGYVGAEGDGVAALEDGGVLHVGRTLPGERVMAVPAGGGRAVCAAILDASPDRVEAPCPNFPVCGGCALQHWADAPYAAWKHDVVVRALRRAGFEAPAVAPLVRCVPGTRRRFDFAARRTPTGLRLGLHAPQSAEIADLGVCLVLHPELERLLGPLRALLNSMEGLRREASVLANLYAQGADLLIRADLEPTAGDRARMAAFATVQGVCRIAWAVGAGEAETTALLRPPSVGFAGATVQPPAGAFLQATAEGESAIVRAVLAGLPKLTGRARVIELYAGIGTLSFPLAGHATVQAYEGNRQAAQALRSASGGTRVQASERDLARQPLQPKELAGAACLVLDPPHTGAAAQMPCIAAAKVPVVIYVSCNPAALARDAAALAQAGYRLEIATPIDQFVWSGEVEAVCVFVHGAVRRPVR